MNGIERIKVLASEVKDEAVLEIVRYLISRTDMNDKYLNEEKSLKQMIDFILKEAKKKSENNMAMIKDEIDPFIEFLDKTFGKGTMVECIDYLQMLKKMS